jgi:molybdopterin-guanine dinucleotide biosynthesis protein A
LPHDLSLPPLVGGLLVGGASRRFGRPKALATLDGVALAERVARALTAAVGAVVLLGDGAVPPALAGLPRLADAPGARGPLAGLLAALRERPDHAWLVAACDQPWLTAAGCAFLLAARRPDRLAVVARGAAGRLEPFPGVYEPGALALLAGLAAAGGALQPLGAAPGVAVLAPPPALAGEWRDVDAESDLFPKQPAS